MIPTKLNKTLLCFKIVGILYYLLSLILIALTVLFVSHKGASTPAQLTQLILTAVLSCSIGTFIFIVRNGLQKGKYWTWIAGIVISGVMIPNVTIVFGLPSMLGLLHKDTKDFISSHNSADKKAI